MAAPGDLCTRGDVLAMLSDPTDADVDMVDRLITAASAALMRAAGREFATLDVDEIEAGADGEEVTYRPGTVTRRFVPLAARAARIHVGDMAAEPSRVDVVTPAGELVHGDVTVECWPLNRRPWEPITAIGVPVAVTPGQRIDVTSTWGFPQVPADIRQACAAQVREWYVRDPSRFGDAFAAAEGDLAVPARELSLVSRDAARAYRLPVIA